jgi:hypothetical protein
VLFRLAGLAVEPRYLELVQAAVGPMQELLLQYPLGFAQWLIALDCMLAHPHDIAIVGGVDCVNSACQAPVTDPQAPATRLKGEP